MKTPTLETDHLILRPITLADAPALQKHFNNWNIIQYLSKTFPWPYPADGAERDIRERCLPCMETGEAMIWVLVPKGEAQEAIGVLEIHKENKKGRGNHTFWLAEPYWGQGFIMEALTAAHDYIFFKLGLDKIVIGNTVNNPASRRIKEKMGARFVYKGTMDGHTGIVETELWEITRESWAKLRGGDI